MKELTTMGYGSIDTVMLTVAFEKDMSDADWSEYVKYAQSIPKITHLVVLGGESQLSANQRNDVREISERNPGMKMGVLTSSRLARGVLTALNWFGIKSRAFAPDKIEDMVEFVNRPDIEAELRATLIKYSSRIPGA